MTRDPLADLPPDWHAALTARVPESVRTSLGTFLAAEDDGHEILPARSERLAAFHATPLAAVRVVIVGQDPYPTPGHAHGLAFSYRGPGALPRSLGNIFREVARDLAMPSPRTQGDLSDWAAQGVLLLNRVLTVRAGDAGSHRRRGWEAITEAALDAVAARATPVVFLLWGRVARALAPRIPAPHVVLEAGHPSPLSVRHFRGCAHFSRCDALLPAPPIRWSGAPGAVR